MAGTTSGVAIDFPALRALRRQDADKAAQAIALGASQATA
jgi:hypothetical protein